MSIATQPQPFNLKSATMLNSVDDRRWYSCVLHLGSNTRWKDKGGGQWRPDPSRDVLTASPPKRGMKHISSEHFLPSVSGREMNGLIAENNRFLEFNIANKRPEGDANRMIVVTDIREVEKPESAVTSRPEFVDAVEAVVTRVIRALQSSQKPKKPTA